MMDARALNSLKAAVTLSRADLRILGLLGTVGPLTASRLGEATDLGLQYLSIRLSHLLDLDLVIRCQITTCQDSVPVRAGWQIAPLADAALQMIAAKFDTSGTQWVDA